MYQIFYTLYEQFKKNQNNMIFRNTFPKGMSNLLIEHEEPLKENQLKYDVALKIIQEASTYDFIAFSRAQGVVLKKPNHITFIQNPHVKLWITLIKDNSLTEDVFHTVASIPEEETTNYIKNNSLALTSNEILFWINSQNTPPMFEASYSDEEGEEEDEMLGYYYSQ